MFHPGKQLAQSHAVTTGGLAQNVSGAYVAKWNFFLAAEVLLLTLATGDRSVPWAKQPHIRYCMA